MNEIITNENIENLIYEVRGKQIMLDSDLARIYECAMVQRLLIKLLIGIWIDFLRIFIFN